MSGADDLRTAADMRDQAGALLSGALPNIKDVDLWRAWQAIERALLANPEYHPAILDAMGLEVAEIRMPEWFNPGHTTDFQAIHVGREHQRYGFDALVVRPRGEATP